MLVTETVCLHHRGCLLTYRDAETGQLATASLLRCQNLCRTVRHRRHKLRAPMRTRFLFQINRTLVTAIFLAGLSPVGSAQTMPDQILLKDYKPRSIYNIPQTRVEKARYAVIDVHSHDYGPTAAEVERWV